MGRWSPRPMAPRTPGRHGLDDWRDDVDDAPEEPIEEHYRRLARNLEQQLHQVTDPTLRARLADELAACRRAVDASTLDDHWAAGDGDRRLF